MLIIFYQIQIALFDIHWNVFDIVFFFYFTCFGLFLFLFWRFLVFFVWGGGRGGVVFDI